MRFVCPKCLKISDIEPVDPEYEIVSVYCLHANALVGGGSEPVRMEPVLEPDVTIAQSEPVLAPACR